MAKVKMILIGVLILTLFSPFQVNADQAGSTVFEILPPTIAGYKTLAVFTSDDTMCMEAGHKRLVLQTDQQNMDVFLSNGRLNEVVDILEQELAVSMSPNQAAIEIANWYVEVVGSGITLEEVLLEHQKWNLDAQVTGCQILAPLPTGTDWTEVKDPRHPRPGYAVFENLDAATYIDDNGQSVNIVAPSIPNSNAKFSVLNNVATDASPLYLLQNGIIIRGSTGHVNWTDTSQKYVAQYYSMPYVGGHTYKVIITYTGSAWFMCAQDNANSSTYTCITETNGRGTSMRVSRNTSVWMENFNTTNSTWYQGWTIRIRVYGAQIYRNGIAQSWSRNHRHTTDSCSIDYPPKNALDGSLTNGGSGYFRLMGVPMDC